MTLDRRELLRWSVAPDPQPITRVLDWNAPASTLAPEDTQAAWQAITTAAEPWLDALTTATP